MNRELRVWWIPQVPMDAFYVNVENVAEAKKVLLILGRYDLFQYEKKVKPDYSNAGGLQMLNEDNEWEEWECDECYEDIDYCNCEDCKNKEVQK